MYFIWCCTCNVLNYTGKIVPVYVHVFSRFSDHPLAHRRHTLRGSSLLFCFVSFFVFPSVVFRLICLFVHCFVLVITVYLLILYCSDFCCYSCWKYTVIVSVGMFLLSVARVFTGVHVVVAHSEWCIDRHGDWAQVWHDWSHSCAHSHPLCSSAEHLFQEGIVIWVSGH